MGFEPIHAHTNQSDVHWIRLHRTLKLRSKFVLKNLIFFQFKIKWSKIRVQYPFKCVDALHIKGVLGELEFYFRKIRLHQQKFLVVSVFSNSPWLARNLKNGPK